MMKKLETPISEIITAGRRTGATSDMIAKDILTFLQKEFDVRSIPKPKRGRGMVSQHDLFRGL